MTDVTAALPADDADAQTIYDFVARHLMTQGEKAIEGGRCLYRTPAGLACAAGCILPDHAYSPTMENELIETIAGSFPNLPGYFRTQTNLIAVLQLIHDDYDPDEWAAELYRLAVDRGLTPYVHTGAS